MKILAIRGCNLASLAGDFAIELEDDPLAHAGLFAICGPTGAGKSTLLDALCVALFDKTPRLSERGGVPVGRAEQPDEERLPANDVRGLLRRGTAEGFAEVDFLGRDQRRYRARWEVRRARRRPEGRLQPQNVSIEGLDADWKVSGTKIETLQAIEDKLGLSFEQFRRSALLAQGEFAAFLRADERVRGELLERMTGTEIYSALSVAAFERQKQETRELADFLAEIDKHAILDDAARQDLETRRELAGRDLAAVEAEILAADKALLWYQCLDDLCEGQRQAEEALELAEAAWHGAAASRRDIAAIDEARAHRAVVDAVDRADTGHTEAEAALAAAQREAGELARAREAAGQVCDAAERVLDQARQALEAARPALAEAENLDSELRAVAQTAAQAEEAWGEAADRAARAAAEHDQSRADMAARERALAEAETWLADNAHLEPLAGEWPRWKIAFQRHDQVARTRRKHEGERAVLAVEHERARNNLAQARSEYDQARHERDAARARADRAQTQADESSLDAVRKQLDAMSARTAALGRLAAAARDAGEAASAQKRHDAQEKAARAQAAGAAAEADNLALRARALEPVLAEAEGTLDRMRRTIELSAHRGALVHGEPCPLCGATEHPLAQEPSPGERMLAEQRARLDELRGEKSTLEEGRARAQERARAGRERAAASAAETAGAAHKLDAARLAWQGELAALGELALMDDPALASSAESVRARLQAAEAELERLRGRERAAAALQDGARHAHSVAAARDSDLAQAVETRGECEARAHAARARLEECERAIERCDRDLIEIADALAAALGHDLPRARFSAPWASALARDAGEVRSYCQEQVSAWQRRSKALADLGVELHSGRGTVEAAAARRAEAEKREHIARQRHEVLAARLVELGQRRARILDGLSPAGVRDELARDIAAREREVRQAQDARQQCDVAVARATERRRACEQALVQRRAERERARADLDEAVARSGLDAGALRERCRVDDDWLARRRDELEAIDSQLHSARAVLAERRAQREKHERTSRPLESRDRDQIQAGLAEQRAAREEANHLLHDLRHQLRADDQARTARAHMAERVARQTQRAQLYQTLSELIGSANGMRFRVFAQSLTLDALLAYANRHLEDLAGRYRLVRVPGYDLDLQVIDRDMGDQVRSINSLSGGESFLVSLSLALGLSSLAARDTQVESLLIDEGFGSLDPGTLETALSVLDALQASGRKVGLISHVPGLAERVGVRIQVRPQGGGRSVLRITER